MSATICLQNEVENAAWEKLVARATDFEELFYELVEEAGRALEADDLEWCALLQEVFIPQVEAKGLGMSMAA